MKKVRIGVVGAGNIATSAHLPSYAQCGNAEVVAIADLNLERARTAARTFNIPRAFNSVEAMLEGADVDAVDICTWNNAHADVAVAAASAGKHVLCEKPLALNLAEGLRMQQAIRQAGVIFMLAIPGRFNPGNQLIRELYDQGAFGEVYFGKTAYVRRRGTPFGWFTDLKTSGGGPIIDIGVHCIDAAWYLMGNPQPVRVSAATSHRIGDYQTKGVGRWIGTPCEDNQFNTEDSGAGVVHFANGAMLLFEASWAINGPEHSDTEICGTKAGATLNPLKIYGERNGYLSDDLLNAGKGDPFLNEITYFADCVQKGKETLFPIDQAVDLQKILQGIYDSARQNKEVILSD